MAGYAAAGGIRAEFSLRAPVYHIQPQTKGDARPALIRLERRIVYIYAPEKLVVFKTFPKPQLGQIREFKPNIKRDFRDAAETDWETTVFPS